MPRCDTHVWIPWQSRFQACLMKSINELKWFTAYASKSAARFSAALIRSRCALLRPRLRLPSLCVRILPSTWHFASAGWARQAGSVVFAKTHSVPPSGSEKRRQPTTVVTANCGPVEYWGVLSPIVHILLARLCENCQMIVFNSLLRYPPLYKTTLGPGSSGFINRSVSLTISASWGLWIV